METQVITQMKNKVESLWVAIQQAPSQAEQERLRSEYRRALETYRLQKLINQGVSA